MSNSQPAILFLGATGGCTLAALVNTLNAGHRATALARTPSKLTTLLIKAGVPLSTVEALLQIHKGNAISLPDVKVALLLSSPSRNHPTLPTAIISGLGAAPKFQLSLNPSKWLTADDPTICGTAASTLVAALQEIYAEKPSLRANSPKPLLCFVSTTGIVPEGAPEDVPFLMRFLYHVLLAGPHVDKKRMEKVFRPEGRKDGSGVFRATIGVRPTLLTSGKSKGMKGIRVGREKRPELGYTVSRSDVGLFIYETAVQGMGKGWEGDMATLTY
ncbi:MAG: hypothetical protein TREMPRED_000905 [Tremellales sp. Tagirdzhanova-0007]|nr:MAG: hypothetical protein TREMPRED_000905 [Tremellales sp. Tagirdzhanova-0007]